MDKRKSIVFAALAIMVAMLLYPPFQAVATKSGAVSNLGYAWLFDPPWIKVSGSIVRGSVNISMLFLQWFMVAVVAAIWISFGGDDDEHRNDGWQGGGPRDALRQRSGSFPVEPPAPSVAASGGITGITVTPSMPDTRSVDPVRLYEQGDWLLMLFKDLIPIASDGDAESALFTYESVMVVFNKVAKVPVLMFTLEKNVTGTLFYCKFLNDGRHANLGSGDKLVDDDTFILKSTADISDAIGVDRSGFLRVL